MRFRDAVRIYSFVALVFLGSDRMTFGQVSAAAASDVPRLEIEKYVLPNGLQVILHVDRKLPMVHVNCWYHVGSKNEKAGRTGFAHLFEHMMFEGSKDANGKYFGFIEKAGANLFEGGVNGTTNEDRTNYFETVPSGASALLPDPPAAEQNSPQIAEIRGEERGASRRWKPPPTRHSHRTSGPVRR